jgi:hypothetical protein
MRISQRAMIAITLALGALAVASMASATTTPSSGAEQTSPAGHDGGAGQSTPGWDGTGEPPVAVPGDGSGALCDAVDPSSDPDTPVSSCPETPIDPTPVEPSPSIVEPTPGMDGVHPTSFDTATIDDDDRTLVITFWSGVEPCYVLDRVDIAYGADTVTVTLFQGSDTNGADVACIDIAMLKQVTVTLDQPLDGRTIVDGAAT